METAVLEAPNLDQHRQAEVASALAGSVAVKKVEVDPKAKEMRTFPSSVGNIVATDSPTELVQKRVDRSGLSIKPSSLDDPKILGEPKIELPDGSKIFYYDFFEQEYDEWEGHKEDQDGQPVIDGRPRNRLVVVSTEGGTRYNVMNEDKITQRPELGIIEAPGGQKLLEDLGYLFVNGQTYIPSPETFKNHCEKLGIKVKIFPDKSTLEAEEYLGAYENGEYPIGALDAFYSHDIQDDHITALVIGGPELQQAIAEGVKAVRAGAEISDEDLCVYIDAFTANFRSAILWHGGLGEAYGTSQGRSTIQTSGKILNIPPEKIDELIKIAQERATKLNLEPKELA